MPKVLNFQAIIEQDENGYYVASVPAVPGCVSGGDSYDEAVSMIQDALQGCLEFAETEPEFKKQIVYPSENKTRGVSIVNLPISLA